MARFVGLVAGLLHGGSLAAFYLALAWALMFFFHVPPSYSLAALVVPIAGTLLYGSTWIVLTSFFGGGVAALRVLITGRVQAHVGDALLHFSSVAFAGLLFASLRWAFEIDSMTTMTIVGLVPGLLLGLIRASATGSPFELIRVPLWCLLAADATFVDALNAGASPLLVSAVFFEQQSPRVLAIFGAAMALGGSLGLIMPPELPASTGSTAVDESEEERQARLREILNRH